MASVVPPAEAQLPRRPAPGSDNGEGTTSKRGAMRSARYPFAGDWEGTSTMQSGPGANTPRPFSIRIEVADSAARTYRAAMILPNGRPAPFQHIALTGDTLSCDQQNSGGGKWIYALRLVARDSLAGTTVLRGAPWHPSPEPLGTVALHRRPGDGNH